MRVRLRRKPKPDSYTESCMINVADGWREGNVWYLGRSVRHALRRVTIAESDAERTEGCKVNPLPDSEFFYHEGPNQ